MNAGSSLHVWACVFSLLYSCIISTLIFGRLILVMSSDEDFDDAAYKEYEDQLYHDESSSV